MSALRPANWLGGIGIATWLFMPIAASSIDGQLLMMWQSRHSIELAVAWVAVAAAGTACLAVVHMRLPIWMRAPALAAALAPTIPAIVNLVGRRFAAEGTTRTQIGLLAVLASLGLVALVVVWRRGGFHGLATRVHEFLTASSILALPFWIGVARLPLVDRTGSRVPAGVRSASAGVACGDIYVVLMDELSYGAVFARGEPTQAALATLTASSRVYHHAMSPSTSTLPSVASYVTNLPAARVAVDQNAPVLVRDDGTYAPLKEALDKRGLFWRARQLGYRTEVFGWYFPYCALLGASAESCHDLSMYNVATVFDTFTPVAPFATVSNMWPYEWPTGLFKRPVAAWFHGAELRVLQQLASAPPGDRPVLRWMHFNVPHRPWLQGNGVFGTHAFDNDPGRYQAQLPEVDRTLTRVLDGLRAAGREGAATIVFTSDHGARTGLIPGDTHWVPLVIRPPHGSSRQDVSEAVEVTTILNDVFSIACATAGSAGPLELSRVRSR